MSYLQTEATELIEEQAIFSIPLEFERAETEVRKLLAGAEFSAEVINSTDAATRRFVAVGLLAALADQETEGFGRAQCAYLDYGYFDETTRDLKSVDSPANRTAAVEKLSVFGGSLATLHLIAALYDIAPEVRRAAVEGLGRVRDPEALVPLNELLAREKSPLLPETIIQDAIQAITAAEAHPFASFAADSESGSEEIQYLENLDVEPELSSS